MTILGGKKSIQSHLLYALSNRTYERLLLIRLYNPGWVLACSTVLFQTTLPSIFSFHRVVCIFIKSIATSSFLFFFRLPFDLVPSAFQLVIIFALLLSVILPTRPYHLIRWDLVNFTISSPLIISLISLFVLILQYPLGSCIGPYIFLIVLRSSTSPYLTL